MTAEWTSGRNTAIIVVTVSLFCGVHGHDGACHTEAKSCELYLDVSSWLPMRRNNNEKVYINETDGLLYIHGDTTNTTVDPEDVVLADGSPHERALILFNKTMPGPTITVYVNQEVIIHVRNHMTSHGVTVHFHGIDMKGTPWMDGAAFVTQCPILPGQTFTYKFTPNRHGTFYYHSHTGPLVSMGLVGAFIVKERKTDDIEEKVMMIQDYNNAQSSDEMYVSSAMLGFFNTEGERLGNTERLDGTYTPIIKVTSSLINGRGRVLNKQGEHLTKTPLTIFTVEKGKQYRFRVIGGGFAYQYKVSVDGHKLTVVAADGSDIERIVTDSIILSTGERFDFILEANQSVGNFWIRAETLEKYHNRSAFAILRYTGAPIQYPFTAPKICSSNDPCAVVNCPFETFPNWTCLNADQMRSASENESAPDHKSGKFKEFFVNVGFAVREDNVVMGHMNGVSLKLPTVSALTQPKEVTDICAESHNCNAGKFCTCNRPLNVDFGDIVQINFVSAGSLNIVSHPIHVHGYSFHVMKIGYGTENPALYPKYGMNDNIKCTGLCYGNITWSEESWKDGNIPSVNFSKLPRKDTVTVPAGGFVVIRFKAENPGLWFIHCHQEYHGQKGLGLLLNDSFSRVPRPPDGFPECRNFQFKTTEKNKNPVSTTVGTSIDNTRKSKSYC
ncbi:uncharacterized protein LOC132746615 isoform X2 [Ruditapes philippinarum]|nr:uncharacterized protein LOC132746615 isoform X2 [Ruditapes philippinarum]